MKNLNSFTIQRAPDGRYYVTRSEYPMIEYPESWGTRQHAQAFIAAELGLTLDEYRQAKGRKQHDRNRTTE